MRSLIIHFFILSGLICPTLASAATSVPKFAYVANQRSNNVSVYSINPVTGELTAGTAMATGSYPSSVAVDPSGKFAYVANSFSDTISVYTINQATGALTAGTTVAAGTSPYSVTVDPLGRFVYAANYYSSNVSVYTINQTTGALTAGDAVAAGAFPISVAVDPLGRFAYAANSDSNNVSVYTINQTTGALTAGTTVSAGAYPNSVTVDPSGKFAYVANWSSNSISIFTINQTTGALTAGTSVPAGSSPISVTVDPTAKFAYVANEYSNNISVFRINQSTGALTTGTAVAAGTRPNSVTVDPTGNFAYAANLSSNNVSVYTINQTTGALTAGTAIAAGTNPISITTTIGAAGVPGVPTNVTATAGSLQAIVSFTAPTDNGGASITSYEVTSSPGGLTATGAVSPISVSILTDGTTYTFTVTATNSTGTGVASTESNTVTAAPINYSLTTNINGIGSINNIKQNSPSFFCSSPSTNCTTTFLAGTSISLYATPSYLFDFAGWSGGACDTGACQFSLNSNTTISATFRPQHLLELVGSSTAYMSFSSAYGDALDGSVIRSREAIINGDVILNRDMSVFLKGGYADGFTAINGFTTIQGKLSINHGRVDVSNIKIGSPAIADFAIAPPTPVTAIQGGSGTSSIRTIVAGGFNSAVALTVSGLPAGATATFNPDSITAPGSGNTTLTLSVGAVTPTGTYTVEVTGTGGGKVHITTISLIVVPTTASFDGTYSGVYSGSDSGSISITLASDGSVTGTALSIIDPSIYLIISGTVTAGGHITLQGTGSASTLTCTGTVTSQGGITGTWSSRTLSGGANGSGSFAIQAITKYPQTLGKMSVAGLNRHQQGGTLVLVNDVGDILKIQTDETYTFPTPLTNIARWVTIAKQPAGQACAFTSRRQDHIDPYTEHIVTSLTADIYCYESPCGSILSLGEAPAPTGLDYDKTKITDTTIDLKWDSQLWAIGYNVYYGKDQTVVVNNAVGLVDYQYKSQGVGLIDPVGWILNLDPDTTYYFAVTSFYSSPSNLAYCQSKASFVKSITTAKICVLPKVFVNGVCVTPPPMVISSFTPPSGIVGTVVIINGTGFEKDNVFSLYNSVSFNGIPADVIDATPISLTVAVPKGATSGLVTVTHPTVDGTATATGNFTVTQSEFGSLTLSTPINGDVSFELDRPEYQQTIDTYYNYTNNHIGWSLTPGTGKDYDWVSIDEIIFTHIDTGLPWPSEISVDISFGGKHWSGYICTVDDDCVSKGVTFNKKTGTAIFQNVSIPIVDIGTAQVENFTGTLHFTPY